MSRAVDWSKIHPVRMNTTTTTATATEPGYPRSSPVMTIADTAKMEKRKGAKFSVTLAFFLGMTVLSACQSISGFSPLDPGAERVAVGFAQALVDGEFELANSFLAPEIRPIMTPEQLRLDYEGMISYTSNPASVEVLFDPRFTMTNWPDKRPGDVGWAYVSIMGDDFLEAVTVIIADYDGELLIREIEWGRP